MVGIPLDVFETTFINILASGVDKSRAVASEKYSSKSDKQVEKLKSPADMANEAAELCLAAMAGCG